MDLKQRTPALKQKPGPSNSSQQLPKYLNPNFEDGFKMDKCRNPLALLEETCLNIGRDKAKCNSQSDVSKTALLMIDTRESLVKSIHPLASESSRSRKRPLSNSTASPLSNVSSNLSKRSKTTPSPNSAISQNVPTSNIPPVQFQFTGSNPNQTSQFSTKETSPSSQANFQKPKESLLHNYPLHLMDPTGLTKWPLSLNTLNEPQLAYLHRIQSMLSLQNCHSAKLPNSCPCYSCQPFFNHQLKHPNSSHNSSVYNNLTDLTHAGGSTQTRNPIEARFCIFCGKKSLNSTDLLLHLQSHVNEGSTKISEINLPTNAKASSLSLWNNTDRLHSNATAQSHIANPKLPVDSFVNPYFNFMGSELNTLFNSGYA